MKKTKSLRLYLRTLIVSAIVMGCVTDYPRAQGANYIQGNSAYVDVAGNPTASVGDSFSDSETASSRYSHQFSVGKKNYGYNESLYYQYSGESIYKNGNPPNGEFTGVTWSKLVSLDFDIPAGWAYSGELLYFSSTSSSVYSGKESVVGSDIDMDLWMLSFDIRAYFLDPFKDFLQPYFGVGWGGIFCLGGFMCSQFKTVMKDSAKRVTTRIAGVLNYQLIGIQMKLNDRAGIQAEFKILRALATTSNDPYHRASGKRLRLNLGGMIIGLSLYYRFDL